MTKSGPGLDSITANSKTFLRAAALARVTPNMTDHQKIDLFGELTPDLILDRGFVMVTLSGVEEKLISSFRENDYHS